VFPKGLERCLRSRQDRPGRRGWRGWSWTQRLRVCLAGRARTGCVKDRIRLVRCGDRACGLLVLSCLNEGEAGPHRADVAVAPPSPGTAMPQKPKSREREMLLHGAKAPPARDLGGG
jgi:hypothetical protein